MEYSKNPLERTQMFTLLLSNGEFLVYSEFDGRMIEVLSKEILSQNKFQNRTLLREYSEADHNETVTHRKREGSYHI